MKFKIDDPHFQAYTESLDRLLRRYENISKEELQDLQRKLVTRLHSLEEDFRVALINSPEGHNVYQKFVTHICETVHHVLAARTYFRERQTVFYAGIAGALRERNWRYLMRYHINYEFIVFAKSVWPAPRGAEVDAILTEIGLLRQELVEKNLPLAINRAQIFWNKTRRNHLDFMDLIQTTSEGLINGVDKFGLADADIARGTSLAGVAIGRMVGNLIEASSETLIHFWPSDKRKLYRANKFMARKVKDSYSTAELVTSVNAKVRPGQPMTFGDEIVEIVAASSTVSADSQPPGIDLAIGGGSDRNQMDRYQAPDEARPDVQVEQAEVLAAMAVAMGTLPLIDRKLLRLKGIAIDLESK